MTETKGYLDNLVDLSYRNPFKTCSTRGNLEQYKNDPEFIAEYKHYLKDLFWSGKHHSTLRKV